MRVVEDAGDSIALEIASKGYGRLQEEGPTVWLVGVAVGTWVNGWDFADPERQFGEIGRSATAAVFGFGMGGMSATFAGWNPVLAAAAALVGGAALVAVARVFTPAHS